ncbi:MAG: hypothetical protein AAB497_03570 [Patescibacteria group bacterium]
MSRFRFCRKRGRSSEKPEDAEFLDELNLPSLMGARRGYEADLLPNTHDPQLFLYKVRDMSEKGGRKRAFYVKSRKELPKKFFVIKAGDGAPVTVYGYLPLFEKMGGCSAERRDEGITYIVL